MLLMPQVAMASFWDFLDFTPSPPIYDRPFAIGRAGSTLQVEFRIKKARGWHFIVTVPFNGKAIDHDSAIKLIGGGIDVCGKYDRNDLGIDTPVLVEIARLGDGEAQADDVTMHPTPEIDVRDARPTHSGVMYAQEIHPHGYIRGGGHVFDRALGLFMFKPGKYRVFVTALKDVAEVQSLETSLSIQSLSK